MDCPEVYKAPMNKSDAYATEHEGGAVEPPPEGHGNHIRRIGIYADDGFQMTPDYLGIHEEKGCQHQHAPGKKE
jgi:hypothetical protein